MSPTTTQPTQLAVAQAMLAEAGLAASDVNARVVQARSVDYWRSLAPELAIGGSAAASDTPSAPASATLAELQGRFARQGYLHIQPELPLAQLQPMGRAVEALRRADWPLVFAFVYDPFWRLVRAPAVAAVVGALLGPGYRQSGDFWLHYVPPHQGAAGWGPHRDYANRPGRLTLWIPLNDAVPQNGCIYVLPRDAVPPAILAAWYQPAAWPRDSLNQLLHRVRALPAAAGSALLWDHDLIHWGGAHEGGHVGGQAARMAFSAAFVAAEAEPEADELPMLDLGAGLPDFDARLHMITQRILNYHGHELRQARYLPLAEALAAGQG